MPEIAHCQLVEKTQSVISFHKLDHIYDRENSATFFYSEVEKCWIVLVNNGTISVDGVVLSSSGNRSSVIEHKANIIFGCRSFVFYNINSPRGMSRMLVDALLKSRREKIRTEKTLRMIQDACSSHKDIYFVLDCILRNDIFDYRCGEISLNVGALRRLIRAGKSPVKDALEYEFEHGFRSRNMGKSFNVNKVWSSPEFGTATDEEPKIAAGWPTLEVLEAALDRRAQKLGSVRESSITDCRTDSLPSPRSSCRYVNSYVIEPLIRDAGNSRELEQQRSGDGADPEHPGAPSSSSESAISESETHSVSEDSDQSVSSRNDVIILKRRPSPAPSSKKCKYYLELRNRPAVEGLSMSGESDSTSVVLGSDSEIERACSRPKPHPRSSSCVEDGFICEKSAGMLDDLVSCGKKRRKVYKIKALSCYDVYKINKL